MEDTAYRNATKRREEIQAELREIDRFLNLWKHYAGTEPEQLSLETKSADLPPAAANGAGQRTRLSRDELAPLIREILVNHGMPLTRGGLVKALTNRGIIIGGTDPRKNLGTIMWRLKDQFINIEGYGYWPTEVASAALNYKPAGDD